jgi:hypothetical protein
MKFLILFIRRQYIINILARDGLENVYDSTVTTKKKGSVRS